MVTANFGGAIGIQGPATVPPLGAYLQAVKKGLPGNDFFAYCGFEGLAS
jgi:hypothetical protein